MSAKEVSELRKSGQLEAAYVIAEHDLNIHADDFSRNAMFWVIRDMMNVACQNGDMVNAKKMFSKMKALVGDMVIVDSYVSNSIKFAEMKLCPNANVIDEANRLVKNGQLEEAYNKLKKEVQHPIEDILHEKYGWIIFRYLKNVFQNVGSLKARKLLFEYMQLHNERPSMLHSQMLNLASKISEVYPDFKFLNFLKLWGVENFTDEDMQETRMDGKILPPLYIRVFRRCVSMRCDIERTIELLCQNSKISRELLLCEYSRQEYYYIYDLSKGNQDKVFSEIKNYAHNVEGRNTSNEYHSKIIKSLVFMNNKQISADTKHLLEMMGLESFIPQDWEKQPNKDIGQKPYPSLVERVVKLYFDSIRVASNPIPSQAYYELLDQAIERYPEDDQFLRYKAQLFIMQNNKKQAQEIYRMLLLNNHKFYLWKELAVITDDLDLKISCLCKALIAEPKEEFVGEVHLLMAEACIERGDYAKAACELMIYKDTYERNSWQLKNNYYNLQHKIPEHIEPIEYNKKYYTEYTSIADEYVYSKIPWTEMVVTDIYEKVKSNDRKQKRAKLVAADGSTISVPVKLLIGMEDGPVFVTKCYEVRLMKDNIIKAAQIKSLDKNVRDIFQTHICFVEYYNEAKNIAHAYDAENNHYIVGNLSGVKNLKFIYLSVVPMPSGEHRKHVLNNAKKISYALFSGKVNGHKALSEFPEHVGIVDGVNEEKQLFHCVFGPDCDAIIRYSDTNLRPLLYDTVIARFIRRLDKNDKVRTLVIDIRIDNSLTNKFIKTVDGHIRTNINTKGERFGFVGDYYIPANIIGDLVDGDEIEVKVVYDGRRWKAVERIYN